MDRNQTDFAQHDNALVYRASYQALERSKAYSVSDRSIGYSQKLSLKRHQYVELILQDASDTFIQVEINRLT
ncbi:hypothetical protein [Hafnia paralvei]|uniref:Uncharacterized protein n=1 Tax=Hafnia paralvei TaxID=546367 RepID=A0A4Q9EU53_9GAMM|nr:hypothetical protein [Hafnia paralvei]TBM28327.1 hypothetical protein EYY89_09060 [Hafnia paralvei]